MAGRTKLLYACAKAVHEPPNRPPGDDTSTSVPASAEGSPEPVTSTEATAASVSSVAADTPADAAAPVASSAAKDPQPGGAGASTSTNADKPGDAPAPVASSPAEDPRSGGAGTSTTTTDPLHPAGASGGADTASAQTGPTAQEGASTAPSRFDHVAPPTFLDASEIPRKAKACCGYSSELVRDSHFEVRLVRHVIAYISPGLGLCLWLTIFIAAAFIQVPLCFMNDDTSDEDTRHAELSACRWPIPSLSDEASPPSASRLAADAPAALDQPGRIIEIGVRVHDQSLCFFDITSGRSLQELLEAVWLTCTTLLLMPWYRYIIEIPEVPQAHIRSCSSLYEAGMGLWSSVHFFVGDPYIVMASSNDPPRGRYCWLAFIAVAPVDRYLGAVLIGILFSRPQYRCFLAIGGAMMHPIVHLDSPTLQALCCTSSSFLAENASRGSALLRLHLRPYIGAPGTVHQAYSLALQLQVTEWVRLARLAAPHSSALPEVLKSGKADVHLAKMVASYAPSTLAAYLSKWRHWIRFASACDANPYDPSIALLLDFLATNSRGKLQTATTWIKSLRFISRKAQLDSLRSALHSDLVSAYGRSGSIVERRES
ncbi:unnamed protein product, partial [Symbiodinium necroappetens]